MKLSKTYPTLNKSYLRMTLLRIILDGYREHFTKNKPLQMDFWLDRFYNAFHSSNDIYKLLHKSYIPRIDARSPKAIKGGKSLTVVPFGYMRKKLAGGETKIIQKAKEAEVIKLMYELKLKGELNNVEIFQCAKKLGYPHRNFGSVSQTLLNPIYVGKYRYNGELIQGNHEPIVAEEIFDAVSEQILSHRRDLASRPIIKLFPLKHSVRLLEGLRSLNGSYSKNGREHLLYYRDTMVNVPKSFNIRLNQFHAIFKGFLRQNLPVQLSWIKQNQEALHRFFVETADKLELINENEIINTNGQSSQVTDLYRMDNILNYLGERLEVFFEVRKLLSLFREKDEFDKALEEEFIRASEWHNETYDCQIQIQHLLFSKGLLFDEDIHQFYEVK